MSFWLGDLRRRTESSQPPDDRTYSPEVTSSRSNLPVHRICKRLRVFYAPSRAYPHIIKENPLVVKGIFSYFSKIFQKISCWCTNRSLAEFASADAKKSNRNFRRRVRRKFHRSAHAVCDRRECMERAANPLVQNPQILDETLSTLHPNIYPWCTPCRTRGICPRCRTAPAACSGWRRRPSPSWPARTPGSRTTWCGQSRPCPRPWP